MESESRNLRTSFSEAEAQRKAIESTLTTTGLSFQDNLLATIKTYEECLRIANQVSLFSPNETLEDINSSNLQYLLISFYLADLTLRKIGKDRKAILLQARDHYERFLKLLDSYDMLSRADAKLFEKFAESPNTFSTASTTDATARRGTKIARFKEEKELKQKLEYLRKNPKALEHDEDALRELWLTNISLCIHQTFQSLESIAQELQVLAMAPPAPNPEPELPSDQRIRGGHSHGYSERLDSPLSTLANLQGPILDKSGKPLRPFTLLDNRMRLQQGVFRPDHNLPTMTIDEYLEEERKRGGIIEGGGPQSAIRPEVDEDDIDKADEETMKARAWDEFKEANPKGSGNTMNRG